jgi:uncharacterized integral membrane protein
MLGKKGFVGLWTDVFKGFFVGLILGLLVMVLIVLNVIPFPVSFCG